MGCAACGRRRRAQAAAKSASNQAMKGVSPTVAKWRGSRGQPIGKIGRANKTGGN